MGKNVWFINQEDGSPRFNAHNRSWEFAKELSRRGYNPVEFAASNSRFSSRQLIDGDEKYIVDESDSFPMVYVQTADEVESIIPRIKSVLNFHKGVRSCANQIAERFGRPDIIVGSSLYPQSALLAQRLAKQYGARAICEVRDIFPLTMQVHGLLPRKGPVAWVCSYIERRMYDKSDAVIFTIPGCHDYISDRQWDESGGGFLSQDKVFYINNGIDLSNFEGTAFEWYSAEPFVSDARKKVVYTGSVRRANGIDFLVATAGHLRDEDIAIYVFGSGGELEQLREECASQGNTSICFMGHVEKRYIPSILAQSDVAIMSYSWEQAEIAHYGGSQNKLFDYLAAGKPVISNLKCDRSIINETSSGIERQFDGPAELAETIISLCSDERLMNKMGRNAKTASRDYSFTALTDRLISVFDYVMGD